MPEPIVFISHFKVKQGKVGGLKRLSAEVISQLQTEKPRTLVFLAYLDEDGSRATFIHVFADATSMDLHVEGAEERTDATREFLEAEGFEIYGRPSDDVMQMMRQAATSGATLTVESDHIGGFLRIGSHSSPSA